MKINIETLHYDDAKTIVDAHVRADDYNWTGEKVPGFPINPFEMGRILMALYLAANFKKLTAQTFLDRFSETDFQAYLDAAGATGRDKSLYVKASLGLKNLTEVFFSDYDCPSITSNKIPAILGNLVDNELTDRDLTGNPAAFTAFRKMMHYALSVARMSGLDATGLDAEDICEQATEIKGQRNGAVRYDFRFIVPGTQAVFGGSCNPYRGEEATSLLQSEIANILHHRDQIDELNRVLSSVFGAYDPGLKPRLECRYRNLAHLGPIIEIVVAVRAFGENLAEKWAHTGIGHHRLTTGAAVSSDLVNTAPGAGRDSLLAELQKTLALEERRRKISLKARKEIGPGNVMLDAITDRVVTMLEPHFPDLRQDVVLGRVDRIMPGIDLMRSVSGGTTVKGKPDRLSKKLPVSFRLRKGRLRCRVPLDKHTSWSHDRLLTRALPETIRQTLVGKPASDVVDHPFTALLGPVTAARLRNGKTEILFDLPERSISGPVIEP